MGKRCGEENDSKSSVIPDEYWTPLSPLKTVKFYKACIKHDEGYETCGKSKRESDEQFLKDLVDECSNTYDGLLEDPARISCNKAALIYYGVVSVCGEGAYKKAQEKACSGKTTSAPKNLSSSDIMESGHFLDADVEFFKDGDAFVHVSFNERHLIVTGVPRLIALAIASYIAKSKTFLIAWQDRQAGGPDHDKAEFVHLVLM